MSYKSNMGSDETVKRMHAIFSGRVQGVGFRFTVCHIAEGVPVTGFVRNLFDGNVELVAEGKESDLSDILHEIRNSQLKRYIMKDRVSWKAATGEFNRFGVLF